tara:strand:+ start:1101 stop:1631 length:531 start_codon:yes stop_codon:yes gene_type:complete
VNRIALISFFFFFSIAGLAQTEIKAPFKVSAKVSDVKNDSTELINIRIRNLSSNTYFIANYPYGFLNPIDSIGYVSLNYSSNYSDPLLMPNDTVDFLVLKPFRSIKIVRERLIKSIDLLQLDFEFIAEHKLDKRNLEVITKNRKKRRLTLTHREFFNDIWYADNATRIVEYELKIK